jgi:hypothetical protein
MTYWDWKMRAGAVSNICNTNLSMHRTGKIKELSNVNRNNIITSKSEVIDEEEEGKLWKIFVSASTLYF